MRRVGRRGVGLAGMAVVLLSAFACSKKAREAPTAPASASAALSAVHMTPSPAPTGDGAARATARSLGMGKAVEGTFGGASFWIVPSPGPLEGRVKLELKAPKEALPFCAPLRARDADGNTKGELVRVCARDASKFAEGSAPFGKDVAYFTLDADAGDAQPPAHGVRYRVSLSEAK